VPSLLRRWGVGVGICADPRDTGSESKGEAFWMNIADKDLEYELFDQCVVLRSQVNVDGLLAEL
jgi:hypothetical protein